ncbi:hypothetical protein Hanom_Chr01g00051461 [Helianthus anomalus]
MHPFHLPFGVQSRPTNPNSYCPNTTQPLPTYNYQDCDLNTMGYMQLLNMPQQYFQGPLGFSSNIINIRGTYGFQDEAEPEIKTVPETQAKREPEASQRGRRSCNTLTAYINNPWQKHREVMLQIAHNT